MSETSIHPDLRSAARWLPKGTVTHIPTFVMRGLMRLAPMPRLEGVTVVERRIEGTQARVRIISPLESPLEGSRPRRPAMLWIHGGGYVIGQARQDDAVCATFAKRLGMTVLSVDYRLAPEHPYPGPLDDCFAGLQLLHREASSLGIDPSRYVIAGASAGGGLAAALTLRAHDSKMPPPRLQLLIYPMLDDRTVHRQIDGAAHRLWDNKSNRFGWESYLGRGRPGHDSIPDHAAPARRVDLSGLPPAWIGVGTADLFHDEDVSYAKRLREAGVTTTLEVVDGAFHGFDAVVPDAPITRQFREAQITAIAQALEG